MCFGLTPNSTNVCRKNVGEKCLNSIYILVRPGLSARDRVRLVASTGSCGHRRGLNYGYSHAQPSLRRLSAFPKPTFNGNMNPELLSPQSSLSTLPAGTHPRLYLGPDDLPILREKLLTNRESVSAAMLGCVRDELNLFAPCGDSDATCHGSQLLFKALIALIDADMELGATIGPQLKAVADTIVPKLEAMPQGPVQCPDSKEQMGMTSVQNQLCLENYQDLEGIIGHYYLVAAWDLAYPFMQSEEREAVRKLAALVLKNPWAIGMNAVPAYPASKSNWIPMVTGDLARIALAMEGEVGANPHALEEIRLTIARFWLVGFLPSGAGLEGAGKNSMGGHLGYLLDRHRAPIYEGAGSKSFQPLLLGMKSARNHVMKSARNHVARWCYWA